MTEQEDPDKVLKQHLDFIANHQQSYLRSGGTEGHIIDMSHTGVKALLPTLLLKTTGRRSGKQLIVPLIYGIYGNEWVVIASKGGSPDHPAWYLNLKAQAEVEFQVASQCFRGNWRAAESEERQAVWDYMSKIYPLYNDYQQTSQGRLIPVVLLKPELSQQVFKSD